MPGKVAQKAVADLGDGLLPTFNADALSNLTLNVESKLKNKGSSTVSKKSRWTGNSGEKSELRRSKKAPKPVIQAPESRSIETPKVNGNDSSQAKAKPSQPVKISQGKKRSSDGKVKSPTDPPKNANGVNGTKLGVRSLKSTSNVNPAIEDDIRALGGTEDDIGLIADAPSDLELENENEHGDDKSGNISKEVQQLIRQLGVDKLGLQEQAYETEDEDEEEHDAIHVEENSVKPKQKDSAIQANGSSVAELTKKASRKGHPSLAFEPLSEWHAAALPKLSPSPSMEQTSLPQALLERVHTHAKSLLEKENQEYAAHDRNASSAHQFYSTIMSTGTLSDKISALTLSVQESPVHNMKALENLVGLARKRSRGQAVEVLGALKDLFGPGNLLSSDRKLRVFAAQPGLPIAFDTPQFDWNASKTLPKPLTESHLIFWAYEDWLKSIFFEVLKIMETWSNDEVTFARGKAVDYLFSLLKEKPEQEANLLRLLVNKLGDTEKRIASKASFNILQLETTHPLMKPTVISAIESDLVFRPGQSLHAKYYALITLNQTVLSGKEESVARKLLEIYFALFVVLLQKPEPAKPARSDANATLINKKGEVQGGGAAGGKKAQKKLAEKEKATIADEELREKMLSAVITGINRALPFSNTNDGVFEKHLNTLFRVTHSSNFNTSVQALMLIQQLTGSHQGSADRFYRTMYESLLDPRLLTSSKQVLYLNLLFKALRSDLDVNRVRAFMKRLLQVVATHQPSFTCGTLYLLRELEGVFANLAAFIDQPEVLDEDEEETFKDVDELIIKGNSSQPPQPQNPTPPRTPNPHLKYDGRKRDPSHSNATYSNLWELSLFLDHYHPSVSLFATRLSTHGPMPPKPDLTQNTLIHFLDRFVYRNPKAVPKTKGASIMQPLAGGDDSGLLVTKGGGGRRKEPVNTEGFWSMGEGQIREDEVFFHRYFNTVGKEKDKAKAKAEKKAKKKRDADGDTVGSEDEADDEIWKALVDSRPKLDEGGSDGGIFSDEDSDEDMEDVADYSDDESEDEGQEVGKGANDDSDNDLLDLEDASDDDALLDSDDEVPLDDAFAAEVQSNQPLPLPNTGGTSRKRTERGSSMIEAGDTEQPEKRSAKRRRLKNLPTFASVDEYAKLLDGDDDE